MSPKKFLFGNIKSIGRLPRNMIFLNIQNIEIIVSAHYWIKFSERLSRISFTLKEGPKKD